MQKVGTGVVSIAEASRVLGVEPQTLRLLLQNKAVDFGFAYKRPGSKQYSYIVYAEPFYQLTGYRSSDGAGAVSDS